MIAVISQRNNQESQLWGHQAVTQERKGVRRPHSNAAEGPRSPPAARAVPPQLCPGSEHS